MKNNYIDNVTWCKIYMFLQTIDNAYIDQEAKAKKFIEAVQLFNRYTVTNKSQKTLRL